MNTKFDELSTRIETIDRKADAAEPLAKGSFHVKFSKGSQVTPSELANFWIFGSYQ